MITFAALLSELESRGFRVLGWGKCTPRRYALRCDAPGTPGAVCVALAVDYSSDLLGAAEGLVLLGSLRDDLPLDSAVVASDGTVGEALAALQTVVDEILVDYRRRAECKLALTDALAACTGLEGLLRVASSYTGNPAFLQDPSSKLMAADDMTRLRSLDDSVLKDTLRTGFVPAENYIHYGLGEILEKLILSGKPLLMGGGYAHQHRRLLMRIRVSDQFVGHLTFLEDQRRFSAFDEWLIRVLSDLVAVELQKQGNHLQAFDAYRSILLELLEQDTTRERLRARCAVAGWSPGASLYCLVIRPDGSFIGGEPANEGLKPQLFYLKQLLPRQIALLRGGSIFVLLDMRDAADFAQTKELLEPFLSKNHLIGGTSRNFSDLMETAHYYTQALTVLGLGVVLQLPGPLYCHWDVYMYELLSRVDESYIKDFCPPKIQAVWEQDSREGTALFQTAYEYLLAGRRATQVARKLFVHKNTVLYRVERFCIQTGLDLSAPEDGFRLYLAEKVLRLLETSQQVAANQLP
ncbi:MAG: helix-turn-helix domain-containing protein [Gracilibacteraceae bacterium]|jgi:hypothetical protein|nr:helix-turn-helix domain-containing protein [Gracilibacteraceae bacterium]